MAIQIGAKPDSGFDDPIGMLTDCHRRIERFLGVLCNVIQSAGRKSLTEEEKCAIQAAVHYFQQGGQRHTSDEEESLFPRLRGKFIPAVDSIAQLQSDHRTANRLHNSIEHLYFSWISSGTLSLEDENQLLSETKQLKELYDAHIHVEEIIVFPYAAKTLDTETLAAIGREFSRRRKTGS
jgi:hemerythrin-like domain-containing protein